MYRTNNQQVAIAWHNGNEAQSNNGNYHTDGQRLYSYRMVIGVTAPNGQKYVLNVRGKNRYVSAESNGTTTANHVRLALCEHTDLESIMIEPIVRNGWRYFPADLIPGYTLSEYGTFSEVE